MADDFRPPTYEELQEHHQHIVLTLDLLRSRNRTLGMNLNAVIATLADEVRIHSTVSTRCFLELRVIRDQLIDNPLNAPTICSAGNGSAPTDGATAPTATPPATLG